MVAEQRTNCNQVHYVDKKYIYARYQNKNMTHNTSKGH